MYLLYRLIHITFRPGRSLNAANCQKIILTFSEMDLKNRFGNDSSSDLDQLVN
jgi:hypothetical protein